MAESNPDGPRKVVLFSGHMIDAPGREKPRFPPDKEPVAAQAIAGALSDLHVGPDDLCICGGACGGDLLFAEAALARSALLEIYIPFEEPTFLEKSVDFANSDWRARFLAPRRAARCISHCANSVRCRRVRIHTSATIAGCWTRRCASARTKSTLSACGTARAATDRGARST